MSTLRTNALEGVDAKNSITIVAGAGNITTTNVQKGLALVHLEYEQDAATLGTSLNISSVTDSSTGNYVPNVTNSFSSTTDRCCAACGINKGTANVYVAGPNDTNTASFAMETKTDGGSSQDATSGLTVHGVIA